MSVRETINGRPKTVCAIAAAVIVVIVFTVFAEMRPPSGTVSVVSKLYFTVDDGKTYFADDSSKIPPFDHDGKQAVQAVVFRCDQGEPFVGYVLRFPPQVKAELETLSRNDGKAINIRMQYAEVKKPGGSRWVSVSSDRPNSGLGDIIRVEGPPGSTGDPQQITP
jgi:hypothetical protein